MLVAKDLKGNLIVKVDIEARRVVGKAYVSIGETVTDIAVGEGSVWITDWQREETLSRLDPETMKVTGQVDVSGDDAVAVGAGAVWLGDIEAGSLTRVDPESLEVEGRLGLFEPPFFAFCRCHRRRRLRMAELPRGANRVPGRRTVEPGGSGDHLRAAQRRSSAPTWAEGNRKRSGVGSG